jgi:hypothetical protein
MWAIVWSWIISAVLIFSLAVAVGIAVTKRPFGLLIDGRGRYSLTHLQVASWSVMILSLIAGTAVGRLLHGHDPLGFTIPGQVLAIIGISLGSGVLSTATKSMKDISRPANVAASMPASEPARAAMPAGEQDRWRPTFRQIYMQEEGTFADRVVDIGKFQNFIITAVLIVAYGAAVVQALRDAGTAASFTALPGFSGTFLTLLGVSHGAYLAAKLPPQTGTPDTSLASRDTKIKSSVQAEIAAGQRAP